MNHIHTMKDGSTIRIRTMDDRHLINTIRMLRKKAENGVTVRHGGGTCAEDMWYDEETYFGKEALAKLNYQAYAKEAERRGLTLPRLSPPHDGS